MLLIFSLLGCERARDIIPYTDNPMRGYWRGQLSVTYSDHDHGSVTLVDSIRFIFTDAIFAYYWIDDIDTSVAGQGSYFLESNVIFSNQMEPLTNPPLTIDGPYDLRFIMAESTPDTMILTQCENHDLNSFSEICYLIKLFKYDDMSE
jgi:hypothetical protein